jgi:hypothetical protein
VTRRASFAIVLALVAYVVTTKVVTFAILGATTDATLTSDDTLQHIGWAAVQVIYLALACLLIVRRPDNRITWIIVTFVSLTVTGVLGNAILEHASSWSPTATASAEWFEQWWYAAMMACFLLLFHWFPTGRRLPGRWGYLTYAAYAAAALVLLFAIPGDTFDKGVGTPTSPGAAVGLLLGASWWVAIVSCIPIVILRLRRSTDRHRQQMKWFLFSVVGALALWVVQGSVPALLFASITLPAVGIGVALLRYRLYDIDRIISRTTAYAVVTAMLLTTYVLIVTSVTRLLPDASTLAVAAATLAAAALARPLLLRVQGIVDRRFNRVGFDADRAVHDFGSSLRTIVDPDVVRTELAAVLVRTLQPNGVRIWLRESA